MYDSSMIESLKRKPTVVVHEERPISFSSQSMSPSGSMSW
jgi:hypothetical protein